MFDKMVQLYITNLVHIFNTVTNDILSIVQDKVDIIIDFRFNKLRLICNG